MKKFLFVLLIAMLLALAFPQMALAMGSHQETPPYVIPEVLQVALLGVATYWIVEGLKLAFPKLTGFGPQLASVLVAMVLAQATDLINLFVPPSFWPLITDVLILAATWLVANGTKRIEKNVRLALKKEPAL